MTRNNNGVVGRRLCRSDDREKENQKNSQIEAKGFFVLVLQDD